MSNNEYREAQQQAREHGLKARHEQRLENATYTAAEVKVLTEAALRLGRAEVGREIEAACEADTFYDVAARYHFARIARSITRQPPQDASSARTDLSVDTDLPLEPEARSNRLPGSEGDDTKNRP